MSLQTLASPKLLIVLMLVFRLVIEVWIIDFRSRAEPLLKQQEQESNLLTFLPCAQDGAFTVPLHGIHFKPEDIQKSFC